MSHRGLALIALLVGGLAAPALADTGGSMGGGSWGGGGGGGGHSSSSSSGGGGYSGSTSRTSGSNASPTPNPVGVAITTLVLFGGVVGGGVWISERRARRRRRRAADAMRLDVSVLRVALDGRARKFVQAELARIARIADTATSTGRKAMLREVAVLLRTLRDVWVYGGADNYPIATAEAAKQVFDRAAGDARAKFREELVRNADGTLATREGSAYTPRTDEGEGLLLVSIILAARQELYTVRIGNPEDLRLALEAASQIGADELVAIEIVWQPAADADRLSSLELEAKYPPPHLVAIPGAAVGRTFCSHCGGPYPAELVSCPHCSAPAPGRDAA